MRDVGIHHTTLTRSKNCKYYWPSFFDSCRRTVFSCEFWTWTDLFSHFLQWFQLLGTNQVELVDEIIEMLVTSIHVCFLWKPKKVSCSYRSLGIMRFWTYSSKCHDSVERMNINVHKNAKQSGEDFAAYRNKIFGERRIHWCWKYSFIVDLTLDPFHEQAYIFWRR